MKKVKLIIFIIFCLFTLNVKADIESPEIVSHKVMVTNKNGTICYEDNKKTDKVIPYGTTLEVFYDISNGFIMVSNEQYSCNVKYSDVSAKTQKFDINNSKVQKIEPIKAIVLAKSGLNMRKGPSVTYSKIVTIPQNSTLKLTHQAGTYWYYTEYNGKTGWITSMDHYLGMDGKEVLISYEPINIYNSSGKAIIGKIPANTEIVTYLKLNGDFDYYVIYNGIKGYIRNVYYKTDGLGKIKLLEDYIIIDEKTGKEIKKITAGQELEYTIQDQNTGFYIPDKGIMMSLQEDKIEYLKKANILIKKTGYIGEGLFGEEKKKIEKEEINEEIKEPIIEEEPEKEISGKDIIIICLLGGIFLALVSLIVIKLVNSKKNKPKKEKVVIVNSNNNVDNNTESENKEL